MAHALELEHAEASLELLCAAKGVSLADVAAELEYRFERACAGAAAQARVIGARRNEGGVIRESGSVVYQDMRVPEFAYHYWGQRLGYECWQDAQFVREFLRDNPECVVKTEWDKTTVLMPEAFGKAEGLKSEKLKLESAVVA